MDKECKLIISIIDCVGHLNKMIIDLYDFP